MKKQTKEKVCEEKKAEEELLALREQLERIRQINRRFAELAENEKKYSLLLEKEESNDQLLGVALIFLWLIDAFRTPFYNLQTYRDYAF